MVGSWGLGCFGSGLRVEGLGFKFRKSCLVGSCGLGLRVRAPVILHPSCGHAAGVIGLRVVVQDIQEVWG